MLEVLLVEDDSNKAQQIEAHLRQVRDEVRIILAESYRSGLRQALERSFDVLCVDMTIPTFDQSSQEPGGRIRKDGGRHLIAELKRRGRAARVIVITQFDEFGEGAGSLSLAQLRQEMAQEFPMHYVGAVFYQASNSAWKTELNRYLELAEQGVCGA